MRHVEEERLRQTATERAIGRGNMPCMVHAENEGDRAGAVMLMVVLGAAIATTAGIAALITGAGAAGAAKIAFGVILALAAGYALATALCGARARRGRNVFLQFGDGRRLRVPADWMQGAVARPISRPGRTA